ncbi:MULTISPECIES: type II secretion system minor pseudopilin GspJ [unclassified Moraxella]|uniref:type II secretion system minor pseudopilin GspJ n=1 Tax=unclassified Moraxella TaxID=2685852 RepID=UPI003AF814B3
MPPHFHPALPSHLRQPQQGFTLIELLVALMIFAMLAMAGWQIMDSLNKASDQAKRQIAQLSELEYAYLQLSQDFAQVNNYVVMPVGVSLSANATQSQQPQAIPPNLAPTFSLNAQQVDFVRFASPDPRLNPPPTLAKIRYVVMDGKLVKQRFYQLHPNANNANQETPSQSVVLNAVENLQWTALTPEPVSRFPDPKTLQQAQATANNNNNNSATATANTNTNQNTASTVASLDLTPYQQLPKGVAVSFTYQGQPITWQFALPSQAPQLGQLAQTNSSQSNQGSSSNTQNQLSNGTNNTNNSANLNNSANTNTNIQPTGSPQRDD